MNRVTSPNNQSACLLASYPQNFTGPLSSVAVGKLELPLHRCTSIDYRHHKIRWVVVSPANQQVLSRPSGLTDPSPLANSVDITQLPYDLESLIWPRWGANCHYCTLPLITKLDELFVWNSINENLNHASISEQYNASEVSQLSWETIDYFTNIQILG